MRDSSTPATCTFEPAIARPAAAFAMGLGGASTVQAKIDSVDISCTNPSGEEPKGQQPSCKGGAHTQETENQNPSGHAPGGHNK